jgi:hypothetical protein
MAEIEGENDDNISNKDKLSNAFATLLTNIKEDK